MPSRDLRDWIQGAEELGELKRIDGADWDVEIGAITELGHHRGEDSDALLFDNIKGYPTGYRVLSNTLNTTKRLAMTLHMDMNNTRLEFVRDLKRHVAEVKHIKPEFVKDGPVMENVIEDNDFDMWKFPTPKWHEQDGGRYIGTGSVDITRDPDDGWVNLGTYRVMVHDRDVLGFYISPGKLRTHHARQVFCARTILQSGRLVRSGPAVISRRRHGDSTRRVRIRMGRRTAR